MRNISWATALCWAGIGFMSADAKAVDLKVPSGVFFFTSPFTPDEMSDEQRWAMSRYVAAKVFIIDAPRLIDKNQHAEVRYDIRIQIVEVYGESDVKPGIYTAKIQEPVFGFRWPPYPAFPPSQEIDIKHVLYCLIVKGEVGSLVRARRRFPTNNRF